MRGILRFCLLIFASTSCALISIATTHHEESVFLVLTRNVTINISFRLLGRILIVILINFLLVFEGLHMPSLPEVVLLDFVSVELNLVLSELLIELWNIFAQLFLLLGCIWVLILVILMFKIPLRNWLLDCVLLFYRLHQLVLIVLLLKGGGYLVYVEPALLSILIIPLHALSHLLGAVSIS